MVPVRIRSGFHRLHTHGSHRSQSDPSGWEGTKTRRNKKARRVPVPHFLFSPERPPSRKQAKRGVDSMMNTAAQAASVFRSWLFFSSFFRFLYPSFAFRDDATDGHPPPRYCLFPCLGGACFALFVSWLRSCRSCGAPPSPSTVLGLTALLLAAPVAATRGRRIFTYWKK